MIKKIGLSLFLVVVALVGLGCSNVLEVEKTEDTGEKSRLIVSLGQMGRLVSPENLNNNDITSFVLSGKKADAADFETIREWTSKEGSSAYDLMTSDTEILVDSGSWIFHLEAQKDGKLVASASETVDVQAGTTTILDFGTMSHITTGNGTVSISLSWPTEEKVTRVVAGLYNREDEELVVDSQKEFTVAENTISSADSKSTISYTATDIPVGNYRFKAQVYQGEKVIATYTELVQVAGNLTSSANRELQNLNTLYKVTFDANNGTGTMNPQTFTAGVEQELAANTTFTREDYIFIGWSEDSKATSATYIDKAKFTANKDTTLYAVWSDKILTFTSDSETALNTTFNNIDVPTGMEYSTDGNTWTAFTKGQTEIPFVNGKDGKYVLYLRGKSPTGTATSTTKYVNFTFKEGTKVHASGDIRTLVDWNDPINADTSNARFCRLFLNCDELVTAPALPAETLAESCYRDMFKGCTSLTKAPELPATDLTAEIWATYCYSSMFEGCTSLETAPALPAEILATYCYSSMFRGCTGLTTAPELKAETLAGGCYESMFEGCTSLETAPTELPATNLAKSCYSFMFKGCTSLTTAPALPVTKLAESCYYSMFEGCESLTTAPALPATNLAVECYSSMFYGCTGLTTAPELPATNLAKSCYSSMFRGCTGLTTAPELPAKKLAYFCYKNMFNGCENLASVTMLATDVSAVATGVDALAGWLLGTAENGTLTVASGMEDNIKIKNSLPSGKNWTVVEQPN